MAVLSGPAGRHGLGRVSCYLLFSRDKEVLGLLSSGFSYEEHTLLPPPSPAPNLAGERGPGSGLDC